MTIKAPIASPVMTTPRHAKIGIGRRVREISCNLKTFWAGGGGIFELGKEEGAGPGAGLFERLMRAEKK
jgi:hypothetical protein